MAQQTTTTETLVVVDRGMVMLVVLSFTVVKVTVVRGGVTVAVVV